MDEYSKIVIENDGNDTEFCKTFVIYDEDHTLANSLRYLIMKSPDVVFCGYSVPHPSESKFNLRIQTRNVPAIKILENSLNQLYSVCEHVLAKFDEEMSNFVK